MVEEEFLDLSNRFGRVGQCLDDLFVVLGTLDWIFGSQEEPNYLINIISVY